MAPRTPPATEESAQSTASSAALPASGDADDIDVILAKLAAEGHGPVASATLLELLELGVDPRTSARGATALAMARELDDPNSATSKSMCAAQLGAAMDRLHELNPPTQESTPLDEVRQRREARLAEAEGRVVAES